MKVAFDDSGGGEVFNGGGGSSIQWQRWQRWILTPALGGGNGGCDNIHSWISTTGAGDLAFSQHHGMYPTCWR